MKIVLTCHTEYDLRNESGPFGTLPEDRQTFRHLPLLRDLAEMTGIRPTWALMIGGPCGENLLRSVSRQKDRWERTGELAIHFHSERLSDGRWVQGGFLDEDEYRAYWECFRRVIGILPKSVVFGKWKVDEGIFPMLRDWGIDHEGTTVLPQRMIAAPFLKDEMVRVPVLTAFDRRPLNPFTQISHWLYLNRILKSLHGTDLLLHVAFHSYDLFDFKRNPPRFRRQKLMVWNGLRKMIRRYGIELLALSEIGPSGWGDSEYLDAGLMAGLFKRLGH